MWALGELFVYIIYILLGVGLLSSLVATFIVKGQSKVFTSI